MYPHIKTEQSITIVINDKPYSATLSHPNYKEIVDIAKGSTAATPEVLLELISPIVKLKAIIGNDVNGFFLEGSSVKCIIDGKDFILPSTLANEVIEVHKDAASLTPLMNFVTRLSRNPRQESIDELWDFLKACGLAITEDGKILAYKNVREDFKDIYTGTMDNSPGQHLTVPRYRVEHNRNRVCGYGLHFAAWGYLKSYSVGGKTVILSIDPADIVSIPTDYNNMKGRASAYTILREVERPEELKYHRVFNEEGYFNETVEEEEEIYKDYQEYEEYEEYDDSDDYYYRNDDHDNYYRYYRNPEEELGSVESTTKHNYSSSYWITNYGDKKEPPVPERTKIKVMYRAKHPNFNSFFKTLTIPNMYASNWEIQNIPTDIIAYCVLD